MANLFDEYGYIAYPLNVNILSDEIKKIVENYQNKELTNSEFKTILEFYGNSVSEYVFTKDRTALNERLSLMIGKFRSTLLTNAYRDFGFLV